MRTVFVCVENSNRSQMAEKVNELAKQSPKSGRFTATLDRHPLVAVGWWVL
jgi:protein-tyrosine-phosphatase